MLKMNVIIEEATRATIEVQIIISTIQDEEGETTTQLIAQQKKL